MCTASLAPFFFALQCTNMYWVYMSTNVEVTIRHTRARLSLIMYNHDSNNPPSLGSTEEAHVICGAPSKLQSYNVL